MPETSQIACVEKVLRRHAAHLAEHRQIASVAVYSERRSMGRRWLVTCQITYTPEVEPRLRELVAHAQWDTPPIDGLDLGAFAARVERDASIHMELFWYDLDPTPRCVLLFLLAD